MKVLCIIVFIAAGCADKGSEPAAPLSTVDSNVVNLGDSTPAILHLDTIAGSDTAFDVAMDSAGRTITARDTIR